MTVFKTSNLCVTNIVFMFVFILSERPLSTTMFLFSCCQKKKVITKDLNFLPKDEDFIFTIIPEGGYSFSTNPVSTCLEMFLHLKIMQGVARLYFV